MKKLLIAGFLFITPVSAWAVCPNPLTVKDAAGATQNISATNDASGNCQSNVSVLDTADATQGGINDAAATAGSTGTVSAKLRNATALLNSILTAVQAPLPPMSTSTACTALCSNLVLEAGGPHNLYSLQVSADPTLAGAPWWIMVYNATSLPANGAVTPLKCFALPAATTVFATPFPTPVTFSTGTTIGVSTTGCFTQTASVHAFISGDAQ